MSRTRGIVAASLGARGRTSEGLAGFLRSRYSDWRVRPVRHTEECALRHHVAAWLNVWRVIGWSHVAVTQGASAYAVDALTYYACRLGEERTDAAWWTYESRRA